MAPTCGHEIVVPASDGTPPDVTLYFAHGGKDQVVPASGLAVTVDEGDAFSFLVVGEDDDGGVRSVGMGGSTQRTCSDPDGPLASIQHGTLGGGDDELVNPGEIGHTGIYYYANFTASCSCTGDWVCTSSTFALSGDALNHHGGRTYGSWVDVTVNCAGSGGDDEEPETCSADETCCEPMPGGGCGLCWPSSRECP